MNSSCARIRNTSNCESAKQWIHTETKIAQVVNVFAVVVLLTSVMHAQTPWSATPASPAAIPANAYPGGGQPTGVWSTLPPPPKAGPKFGNPAGAINPAVVANAPMPTFVSPVTNSQSTAFPPIPTLEQLPLTQQPLVSYSNLAPLPQQSPAPNASQSLGSLPPPSQSLPNFVQQSASSSNQSDSTQHVANRTAIAVIDEEFNAGELIAVVGSEHILSGDMAIFVEPIIEQNRSKISPTQEKELRATLVRQVLSQYVQVKALYQEFFRDMAGNKPPKEIAEMQAKVTTKAGQIFFEKQVPSMMKKYKVNDVAALELALQAKSMSLASYRTQFIERILSSELERKYVPEEYEFSREELLAYYQGHPEEWTVQGRAKWRELCIRFAKHSRDEAEQMIRALGDQVYLGGQPFEAVAKNMSEGFTAKEGGFYDWTTQGSLKSKALDTAIFSLPLRRLSLVIEDEIGFHIIEVLEREDAHTKSFDLAQVDIRQKLAEERKSKLLKEFHDKVMARTPVWTKWPQDIPGSRDITEALGME